MLLHGAALSIKPDESMLGKVLLLVVALCLSSSSPIVQADLVITIAGLRNSEGTILAGVFDRDEGFPDEAFMGKTTQISGNSARVIFEDLKPGRYALAIIHDENGNGKLDTNGFGIPSEGFCFGNNAMGLFGPPSFRKASVSIEEGSTTHPLKMKYF